MQRRRGFKKRVSKAKCQTIHARRRAIERYGVELDVKAAVMQIKTGIARFLEKQSLRVSVFEIVQNGVIFPVVYDRYRQTIVTCLPQEYQPTPPDEGENYDHQCK